MQQLDTCTSVLELMWSGTGTSVIAARSEKQCKGVRMKVAGKNKVPGNWIVFYVMRAISDAKFF